MFAHIDVPADKSAADPNYLWVQGWVWLAARQCDIASIQAQVGDQVVGETSVLYIRPDVARSFGLSDATRLGFTIPPRIIPVVDGPVGDLAISVKLRDGTLIAGLSVVQFTLSINGSAPLKVMRDGLSANPLGLEIGAHAYPVPFLTPFYTDAVKSFSGTEGRVDFLSDARCLPIGDGTLDYLCSSHVLEHLPNPLGALFEWHRVLKPGGLLYLVVPDMRFTFDHLRELTTVEHLLEDFHTATERCSIVDIREFVEGVDWSRLRPSGIEGALTSDPRELIEEYGRQLRSGQYVDIHYHTFTPTSLEELLDQSGLVGSRTRCFDVLARAERYLPDRADGIAVLLRKGQGPSRSLPPTFRLEHAKANGQGLSLFCPVSLRPLRTETTTEGEKLVREPTRGFEYPIDGILPSFLPPVGVRWSRVWNHPVSRLGSRIFWNTKKITRRLIESTRLHRE